MGNKSKQPRRDKPRRPPQELPAALDLDYTEVEEGEEEQEPKKELLFRYKGKDYYMVQPEHTVVMDIMEAAADRSDIGAMGYMVRLAIGPENWRVLKNIPNLKNEEMNQIFDRAMTFMMGSIGELGN